AALELTVDAVFHPVTAILGAVPDIFAAVADIFHSVALAALMLRVPFVFDAVTLIFLTVADVFAVIADRLALVMQLGFLFRRQILPFFFHLGFFLLTLLGVQCLPRLAAGFALFLDLLDGGLSFFGTHVLPDLAR